MQPVVLVSLLLESVFIGFATGQSAASCRQYSTCSACIRAPEGCYWCIQESLVGPRCLSISTQERLCPDIFKEDPKSSLNITQSEELSDRIQVTPTVVEATLTPGYAETFNITVRPADDYPLDLYFLMDFSFSTIDDLFTMRRLATNIVDALDDITSNYRFGFGNFVDKVLNPFVYFQDSTPTPTRIYDAEVRCFQQFGTLCQLPFSFVHLMSMTNDSHIFSTILNEEISSWNFDTPEGGLDGLLQVMECQEVIGWRDNARHIVIYMTDAGFHMAYDGKLLGALHPHDGKCHLEIKEPPVSYEEYKYYDYPSISQIYASMAKHNIVPIFAVSDEQNRYNITYAELVNALPGAAYTALQSDSSNIVDIVSKEYQKASQTVRLVIDEIAGVNISVVNRMCPEGATPDPDDPAICHGVLYNRTVVYTVSVEITEVIPNEEVLEKDGVTLRIPLYADVKLKIRTIQNCSCEDNSIRGDGICSNQGSMTCEVCHCDEGFYGPSCSCAFASNDTTVDGDNQLCPMGENGLMCSGRGICECGACVCDVLSTGEYYYGTRCECDNFRCQVGTNNQLCSGHGTCQCGDCMCSNSNLSNLSYTGEVCECSPDVHGCINPQDPLQRLCSGQGKCDCDRCLCHGEYFGDYCQPREDPEVCAIVHNCLECLLAFEDSAILFSNRTCNRTLCPSVVLNQTMLSPDLLLCKLTLQDCYGIEYSFGVIGGAIKEVIVRESFSNCTSVPPSSNAVSLSWQLAVPMTVVFLVLGVLIIVAIKICLVFKDRYDYAKWKKNRAQERHMTIENPLYLHRNVWGTIGGAREFTIGEDNKMNPLFEEEDDQYYMEEDVGYLFAQK